MEKVAIIDYGMGNLDSVAHAVEECGGVPMITSQPGDLELVNRIILPGVGAFAMGMQHIHERGLIEILGEQVIGKGVPFLGICLGMQILATKGYEGGETKGLGWIEGEVKRFESRTCNERIPHIGWNEVVFAKPSALFTDIPSGKDFYFVHSYHLVCSNEQDIIAHTNYCGSFISAVRKKNIFGVQFHPEKSQRAGFQVIKNFLKY